VTQVALPDPTTLASVEEPQVVMVLRHDGHGDPRRAGLAADLVSDLRPLQALIREGAR
jgi:hypothetical protein